MKRKPRAGILPLFLKLYDDCLPDLRDTCDSLTQQVEKGLSERSIGTTRAPVCRLKEEFASAVNAFEKENVDILISLHLAYSPSLESVDALAGTHLPVLMLDTTMDYDFGRDVDPKRILFNHGIHGVQDLACMLRRTGKPYEIAAGHVSESNVLDRTADIVRAAYAAASLSRANVLRIGDSFQGMGDFSVSENLMRDKLGISVTTINADALVEPTRAITDEMIAEEMARDHERFTVEIDRDVHQRSVRVGLGLRSCLEKENYSALSANFLAFDHADGPVDTVPFLEISKAMARGVGYAGEGDALTAAFVGALLAGFEKTTFTEIFCPDWKGNSLFLSHMGEINPAVCAGKPLLCEKDFPFTPAQNPAVIACSPAPGPAVFVNLAPGPDDSFRVILSAVEALEDATHPDMRKIVRGWIKPSCAVQDFLEQYSRFGGTHHSALIIGDHAEAVGAFARFAGIECCVIK